MAALQLDTSVSLLDGLLNWLYATNKHEFIVESTTNSYRFGVKVVNNHQMVLYLMISTKVDQHDRHSMFTDFLRQFCTISGTMLKIFKENGIPEITTIILHPPMVYDLSVDHLTFERIQPSPLIENIMVVINPELNRSFYIKGKFRFMVKVVDASNGAVFNTYDITVDNNATFHYIREYIEECIKATSQSHVALQEFFLKDGVAIGGFDKTVSSVVWNHTSSMLENPVLDMTATVRFPTKLTPDFLFEAFQNWVRHKMPYKHSSGPITLALFEKADTMSLAFTPLFPSAFTESEVMKYHNDMRFQFHQYAPRLMKQLHFLNIQNVVLTAPFLFEPEYLQGSSSKKYLSRFDKMSITEDFDSGFIKLFNATSNATASKGTLSYIYGNVSIAIHLAGFSGGSRCVVLPRKVSVHPAMTTKDLAQLLQLTFDGLNCICSFEIWNEDNVVTQKCNVTTDAKMCHFVFSEAMMLHVRTI